MSVNVFGKTTLFLKLLHMDRVRVSHTNQDSFLVGTYISEAWDGLVSGWFRTCTSNSLGAAHGYFLPGSVSLAV